MESDMAVTKYETVIGLEVHVELSTKTKIFCGCSTEFGGEPNSHTCPVCLGMPGSLPVLNEAVVEKAIAAGLALHCEIPAHNVFDRKNYFYPDLPKAYQISQLYQPICQNGWVEIQADGSWRESAGDAGRDVSREGADGAGGSWRESAGDAGRDVSREGADGADGSYPEKTKRIRIHEIHMEEDAGKMVHEAGASLVDYNRCGVPLIEIVSEPDIRSADEAVAYLEALRETLVYLGVSDCKMQEGSMRADVNLSVRPAGSGELGTRTETKNMNSVKAIRRAIAFEEARQVALLEKGERVVQETRRWDDAAGVGYAMRSKENAQDYRYFPDPDLVPLNVGEAWAARIKEGFPELADAKRRRYVEEYGLPEKTAQVLTAERAVAELFEGVLAALGGAGAENIPSWSNAAEAANAVTGEMMRLLNESGRAPDDMRVDAAKVARVLAMVRSRRINRAAGREAIEAVFMSDADPEAYVAEKGLALTGDADAVRAAVGKALSENAKSVEDYRAGKEKAFGFLVGQVMRAFGGKADPAAVNAALREALGEAEAIGPQSQEAVSRAAGDDCPYDGIVIAAPAPQSPSDTPVIAAPAPQSLDEPSATLHPDDAAALIDERRPANPERRGWGMAMANMGIAAGAGQAEGDVASQAGAPLALSARYRDMTCGDLRESHVGQRVRLAGWVMAIRNHGGIVFVDLRDMHGVTQLVVTDEMAGALGKESSISAYGDVVRRADETVNPNIATGTVELKVIETEMLGPCKSGLPFEIGDSRETREEVRLKYRYLDLRNPLLLNNLILRTEVIRHLRGEMEGLGFLEVQTPILANSSPEGARDYLVPSRKHKGRFYALPQAPQQFKQLLMVSGIDRYYQIAPCFRDEDARLDRSPGEFYQLDFELAYATQEDVLAVAERVLTSTFGRFSDKPVTPAPFARIPYRQAMLEFGSDKPDLRNPLRIFDLSGFFAGVDFAPFKGRTVRAIRVPGAAAQPKSFFREMEAFALGIGMKGLGYVSVQEGGAYKGPIDKFMDDAQKGRLAALARESGQPLSAGDVLYFISDEPGRVEQFAGQIRREAAERLGMVDKDRFDFCFVTDYPMYERNEETGGIDFTHNPFSMPQGEMAALLEKDPLDILAWQYDVVCNGVELSSGAVRNHRPDIMVKAFEIAGYSEKDVEAKFGALYSAFGYGAPPHAGMAPGVDRIVMLLAGEENIRETIAFPLNSNAQNLMLDAPSEVTEQQLREVHIKIR